ncbi:helix-turn-helix transcriptional regulator [Olivibacter sp. SDN3]|uniref:AraC family transcriptional regulator n=1 Tax=Olivibacter sp. SDN3 TaxID=2764720 RepID=UPI001651AAF6|nr:AraC family transcriptional regulator [Olivibacter sp. SDN3]QNL47863.1 helix-turn-helix transcriptional regulator [Olivibacter sp. SDN3]
MLQLRNGKYLGSNKRNWDADGILVSEIEYHKKVFEGWHYHENQHLTFILRGGNREQRKNKELETSPGDIVFYESGELHRNFGTKHPSKNINIEIAPPFFSSYDLDTTSFAATTLNYTNAKFALLKTYHECLTMDEDSQTAIHALLLSLMTSPDQIEKVDLRWVKLVREILNDQWNEQIPLREIATLVQVHPVTVSKFFPKYFHCTLGQYIRKLRIDKATTLLANSQLSLTEIAYQCGFFDQSHFIRVFKQITGFLPKEYRKL